MTPSTADYLTAKDDFNSLSIHDLLDARDLWHERLMHKPNVVGTAIGSYLIRRNDPWPQSNDDKCLTDGPKGKRTLANSEVRPYSWPCVLVFVREWQERDKFGGTGAKYPAEDIISKAIYLPGGKKVPVCVVEAPLQDVGEQFTGNMTFPNAVIGGGYPLISVHQGQEHVASIGCLLSDGHTIYALTNRHVSGMPGEVIYTLMDGERVPVGRSSDKQLTRMLLEQVYPDWTARETYLNLDIGLIEIDDLNQWTAQVYGIGRMGKLADLSPHNISLRLIDCPVCAYGCASRKMTGAIKALFYRYKSVAGFEHVADFLIGPREAEGDDDYAGFQTHPGDSGTVWMIDAPKEGDPRPIAVQWGGHVFVEDGGQRKSPYALATCLSTVCNLLDVEIVRDWNLGFSEYWGAVGHYTIATSACDVIENTDLKKLMGANVNRISFHSDDITDKNLQGLSKAPFVPLADVPDYVWKNSHYSRGNEGPNHFADMDRQQGHKNLLQICNDPANIDPDIWLAFCGDFKGEKHGLLPFRVWQIYDAMVEYVKAGKAAEFVCAAGVLSHYVGDACQPLHISYLFDGDPDREGDESNSNRPRKKTDKRIYGGGVHAAYENSMINHHVLDIRQAVADRLGTATYGFPPVKCGRDAAVATVWVMKETFKAMPPMEVVEAFAKVAGGSPKQEGDGLWQAALSNGSTIGEQSTEMITMGAKMLAYLWDCAWSDGKGSKKISELGQVSEEDLRTLYQDRSFLESCNLGSVWEPLGLPEPAATG